MPRRQSQIEGEFDGCNSSESSFKTTIRLFLFKAPAKRSQHFKATYRNIVGRNMLRAFGHPVATYWVLFAQIWNWPSFSCNICGCGTMLWLSGHRFMQHCWPWACALVRFSIPNMSQHVASWRPNARNMLHQKLGDMRLVSHKNVAIVWPEFKNAFSPKCQN